MFRIGDNEYSQPCLSDPENIAKAKVRVREYLDSYPDARIVGVTQNDNDRYCTCAECARINREEGSNGGTLIRFINAIADDIKDDYPDVKVLTLAYMYSVKAPLTPPRDNVIIELCAYDFCVAHPYGDCDGNAEFLAELKSWNELTDNLFVWDYIVDFYVYDAPFMDFDSLYDNVATFRKYGVKGMFFEGRGGRRSNEFGELRSYLLARLMWDKDITRDEYERMICEFIDAYYGAGSKTVQRYFDFLRRNRGTGHFDLYSEPNQLVDRKPFTALCGELARWLNTADKLTSGSKGISEHISRLRSGFEYLYKYFNSK